MSKTSPLAETAVVTPEVTDETLILAARELNASYNGHLKRSIEDFWRLGETLSHLFERRHLKGRWADILAEIGINVTTDNHARRLYKESTIEGLAEFKNKTAALRYFGILSTPSVKIQAVSPSEVPHGEMEESTETICTGQMTAEPHSEDDGERKTKTERPDRSISPPRERRAAEVHADQKAHSTHPVLIQADVQQANDSLEILAKIAARLEYLAADTTEVSPDHLAQIDRMIRAIDVIRSKGVVDAI